MPHKAGQTASLVSTTSESVVSKVEIEVINRKLLSNTTHIHEKVC